MSKVKTTFNAWVTALLVLVIFVAVNAFAARSHTRWDLTENQIYTLAPGLQKILRDISEQDNVVQLAVYITNKVPGHAVAARDRVLDLLRDIDSVSGGSVEITYIDPQDSDTLADEAAKFGVQQVQMIAPTGASTTIANIYAGIVIKRENRHETIGQLLYQGRNGVIMLPEAEYEIAAALVKVATGKRKTIGFLAGHQEPSLGPEDQGVQAFIKKVYNIESVDTAATGVVPPSIDLLVVRSPQRLDERDRYAIDQFVMTGKPVVFLMPHSQITDQGGIAGTDASLFEQLIHYGAEVQDLVLVDEARFGPLTIKDPETGAAMLQPTVSPGKEEMDPDSPITSRLDGVQLLIASPVVPSANLGARTFKVIVKAPETAATVSGLGDINFSQQGARVTGTATIRPIAPGTAAYAVIEGPQVSAFKGKPVPPAREGQPGGPPPPEELPFVESAEKSMILVAGYDFLLFNQIAREPRNIKLVQNTFDHLVLSEELISVRSRTVESRPLSLLSENAEKEIRDEIVETYKKENPEFQLNPSFEDLRSYDEAKIKQVRKARNEISDAQSEALKSQKIFYYVVNFGLMPVLLVIGGIWRFVWRRQKSRRVFSAAGA